MTWIGVNTFQKFQLRQLRQWVFFGAIWLLHLDTLRKLHTKHWFALSSSMQHLFGIPIMKLRLDRWRRCRGQLPGGPAGDGGTPVASAICLTNLSGHPWRHAGSSLHNNLRVRLSPIKSPVLHKYLNPFKRPSMYPSISKCNAKSCNCCQHLCTNTSITSSVNGRTFSVINNSDLD